MKPILIVAATSAEIRGLFENHEVYSGFSGNLVPLDYHDHMIDILVTGPGMVPTAFYLGQWLGIKTYDLVINAGIAGSFKTQFAPGTVVNVISDIFPELGAQAGEEFIPLYNMEMSKPYLPVFVNRNGVIENQSLPPSPTLATLPRVKGITVNTISGNEKHIAALVSRTDADIETMEGAAFFFACRAADVPCIQLRAISNYVEPRNLKNWDVDNAVKNLNSTLKQILDEL